MASLALSIAVPNVYTRLASRPFPCAAKERPLVTFIAASSSSSSSSRKASTSAALAAAAASPSSSPSPAAKPAPAKAARGSGLKKPQDISPTLQQFLGSPQASRADTMKLVWEYIKCHDLQSANDRRLIICDEKLKGLFGKDQVNFLEIARLLNPHFLKST